jgi:hypothetical protein
MVSKQPERSQNAVGFSGFAEKVKLEITNEINAHKKGEGRDSSIEKLEEIYREVEQMVKIRSDKEFSPRYPRTLNDSWDYTSDLTKILMEFYGLYKKL